MYNIKTLNEISPVYESMLSANEYNVSADIENPDAIIVRSAAMHGMEIPASLMAVGRAGAGVNNIPLEDMGKAGVVVFNSPGANANAVKELAIAALLMASRDILGSIEWTKTIKGKGADVPKLVEKGKGQFTGPEIMGKTLGVIGLGGVGGLVANAANSLGMCVLGYDPYLSVQHAWRLSRAIEHAKSEYDLLSRSDYVSVHTPVTEETRGKYNKALFSQMKPGAVLINFSRGELVVDADMIEALASGQLKKYVTDFPSDALIGNPNVIAIPHLGASTPESEDNCVTMVAHQIDSYLKTGSIINAVNYPDCELEPCKRHRVAVMHANVPNVVGPVTSLVASRAINIDSMTNKSRGQFAYMVLDLDDEPAHDLLDEIAALDTVYRVRVLQSV